MRSTPVVLGFVGLAFAATAFAPSIAEACSCVRAPSATSAAENAGAVFEGEILGIEHQGNMNVATVKVLRTWKGIAAAGTQITVQTADNGATCGREFTTDTYLFYVRALDTEGEFQDNMCTLTKLSSAATDDFAELGTADGTWTPPADGDGGTEPEEPEDPGSEPEPINPFERGGDDAATATPPAGEPAPSEPNARGCSIASEPAREGAAWAWLLAPLLVLRRRR